MDKSNLGGRLPLRSRDELTDDQRALFDRMSSKQVPWAHRHHFTAATSDGKLLGPFNPLLHRPGTAAGFLDFEAAEDEHSTIGGRLREVIILSVGSVFGAEYEMYAHSALAREHGLSEAIIEELTRGQEAADELSQEEKLGQRCALAICSEHRLSPELYAQAEQHFGVAALIDIALLIGRYSVICTLLNTFAVPAPTD